MPDDLTPAEAVAKLKRLLTRDAEDGYGNVVVKFAERRELHDALNLLLADHARLILALGEAEQDRDTLTAWVKGLEATTRDAIGEPMHAQPIGNCQKCGALVYTDEGFCGNCSPGKL